MSDDTEKNIVSLVKGSGSEGHRDSPAVASAKIEQELVDELMGVLATFSGRMTYPQVLGCLELITYTIHRMGDEQ